VIWILFDGCVHAEPDHWHGMQGATSMVAIQNNSTTGTMISNTEKSQYATRSSFFGTPTCVSLRFTNIKLDNSNFDNSKLERSRLRPRQVQNWGRLIRAACVI